MDFYNFLKFLSEAEASAPDEPKKKTKTDTRSAPDLNFTPPSANPLDSTKPSSSRTEPQRPELKKASQADTLRATRNISPTDDMRNMLNRMRDLEADPDDPGYPDPEQQRMLTTRVDTDNLPAQVSKAMRAEGEIVPTFHKVANLPGNMVRAIRTAGRKIFGAFTNTPTDEIHMIGNLGGQGPNSSREVNAVVNFVHKNGNRIGEGEIDLSGFMPGYTPEYVMYSAAGIRWMLIRDFAGEYVYCWPEQDSKNDNWDKNPNLLR